VKFALTLLAAFLFSTGAALADGIVTVHVVDAHSGKPIAGQTVRLTDAQGDFVSNTDKRGDALFISVPVGRSTAVVDGYLTRCLAYFTVGADQHRYVTLRVRPFTGGSVTARPLCHLNGLVNPGQGADVYEIF
jgi:hypothetical protein